MQGWYVVQVRSGRENVVAGIVRRVVDPSIVHECFCPRWQTQRKIRGEWSYVERSLIPGYLIVVTDKPGELEAKLRQVPELTKLVRSGENVIPLEPDEVTWIDKFTQGGNRVVPMSSAVKEGDEVIITDGPLREYKTKIKRIDRHRSTAYIEVHFLGRTKEVPVGLKIVAKASG